MDLTLQTITALLFMFLFTVVPLSTRHAFHTGHFLVRVPWFWWMVVLYSAITIITSLALGQSSESGLINIPGVEVSNPYVRGFMLVASLIAGRMVLAPLMSALTKTPLKIQYGEFSTSKELLTGKWQVLSECFYWAEGNVLREHQFAIWKYVDQRAVHYPDIEEVRERVVAHISATVPLAETAAISADLADPISAPSVGAALEQFIKQHGKRAFDDAFPVREK